MTLEQVWIGLQILGAISGVVGSVFVLYMSQHYISRDTFYEHVETVRATLAAETRRIDEKAAYELDKAGSTIMSVTVQMEQQNAVLATLNERSAAHTRLFESTVRGLQVTLEKTDRDVARILDCLLSDRAKPV